MAARLPAIIVTGASGFVGRHFLEAAKESFIIYGLARRSQRAAGVADHPHIRWIQVDLGNWAPLKTVLANIKERGGVDYVYHLAGYYDFTFKDHPEYQRTNVDGTRHILELAKWLCVRRFVFASSLAACRFPPPDRRVNEQAPPDAAFAYARSKRAGEELTRRFAQWLPSSVVRFAAVFSDWCEYAPLYSQLDTWLSRSWRRQILGGHGRSAITYIHIDDLTRLALAIFRQSERLPDFDVYHASPNGTTTHLELYELATRFFFGRRHRPLFVPRVLAHPGMHVMQLAGHVAGRVPFERPWMAKYIDRQLIVDSSYTQKALGWEPAKRNHVLRRLLFLIENLKSSPETWQARNEAALRRVAVRPSLLIYEALQDRREVILERLRDHLRAPHRSAAFRHYQQMEPAELQRQCRIFCDLLLAAIRTGDRTLIRDYVRNLLPARVAAGFEAAELTGFIRATNDCTMAEVARCKSLRALAQETYDSVTLTLELVADEVESVYERLADESGPELPNAKRPARVAETDAEFERLVSRLNAFHEMPPVDSTDGD